jgi:DNA-binding MarR family transcriptional regulator/predicted N-acetyltransferase YhbS
MAQVDAIRSFNRFYTGVIGVLGQGLLGTEWSLTEVRVLFELARGGDVPLAELRRDLDLDGGYLTRIVDRLVRDGLAERARAPEDGRARVARLTARGREAFAVLDARSAAEIEALLAPLDEAARERLVASMDEIRTLLEHRDDADVRLREPQPGDLGWVVARHGALYAREYGWDETFEHLVARIVADFAAGHDPARERAWIAQWRGQPVGSIFCVRADDRTAKLRLLLVEPGARGLGVGTRLVEACVAFARTAGYAELVLWTNDVLADARRLYERAGFRLVEQGPHRAFGHDLVEQTWSLRL